MRMRATATISGNEGVLYAADTKQHAGLLLPQLAVDSAETDEDLECEVALCAVEHAEAEEGVRDDLDAVVHSLVRAVAGRF